MANAVFDDLDIQNMVKNALYNLDIQKLAKTVFGNFIKQKLEIIN